MQTSSPKKMPRAHPRTYSTCLLYNSKEAKEKLKGLTLASCNPVSEHNDNTSAVKEDIKDEEQPCQDLLQLSVSDKMSCNFCDTTFSHRLEQKRHYRSDWHRYNLKQRIKGKSKVSEEQFEDISGNISSLSGSDSDEESDSDAAAGRRESKPRLVPGVASQLRSSQQSSTDSESDTGNQALDRAHRLPKLYFRNEAGELLSIYRCVICHKKEQPSRPEELISMVTDMLGQMYWAVFMVGGGHFAAAIYNKDQLVAHKTFHRYVVRAKRGTAQSSRDSQGNAPKSAGASLRRYNEAALTQDIQDLINSWSQHIKACDRIFLRAPSFNRKIFFGGKTPVFSKEDPRIRLIPFQTRRPTFNEVRRVFEMLASIECYGDESELQDLIPISPPQVFDPQSGQLTVKDESQLTPRQRKLMNRKLKSSPLATEQKQGAGDTDQNDEATAAERLDGEVVKALPEHVLEGDPMSSGASTASDTELLESMETMNLADHKEFYSTKKPKRRKKSSKQRRQTEPESNVMDEEKYHLKNSLYTACKVGDTESLKNLLAVFTGLANPLACTKSAFVSNITGTQDHKQVENVDKSKESIEESFEYNREECLKETEHYVKDSFQSKDIEESTVEPLDDKGINKDTPVFKCVDAQMTKQDTYNKDTLQNIQGLEASLKDGEISNKGTSNANINGGDERKSDTGADSNITNNGCGETKDTNSSVLMDKPASKSDQTVSSPRQLPLSADCPVKGKEVVSLPDMSPVVTLSMLNESFGDNNTTLLHVAAREGHRRVVVMLMEAGADPALREKTGHTPYMVSKDKPTRNEFRKFMGQWPDKFDYEKAQIPSALTDEMETEKKKKEAEKRKAQKKVKQKKQKLEKEEKSKKEAEEKEKQRFLNLSDREKRALAAERRLLTQASASGTATPVLVRCFQCGGDMTGKIPFEYNDNKFCIPKCLQLHRKSAAKS